MTTANTAETQLKEVVDGLDTKLSEAAALTLIATPATPREIVFRMNGTFTETVTIGGQSSMAEGKWKVVSAKGGGEFLLELGRTSDVAVSVTVMMLNDQTMLMRQRHDDTEAVTLWKRMK